MMTLARNRSGMACAFVRYPADDCWRKSGADDASHHDVDAAWSESILEKSKEPKITQDHLAHTLT